MCGYSSGVLLLCLSLRSIGGTLAKSAPGNVDGYGRRLLPCPHFSISAVWPSNYRMQRPPLRGAADTDR